MSKVIVVIDGQGGKIGKQLVERLLQEVDNVEVIAVGTNSIATSNMIKGGAEHAATGENPVIVASRNADIIIGPIGIVIADSLYGEITPAMAVAVGQSNAKKILIPMNKCDNLIVGVVDQPLGDMIKDAMQLIKDALQK